MEEKHYFKSGDLTLSGILIKPAKKTYKCIVLCHGITVDKNEHNNIFAELAKKLAEKGFAVFRFDFRAHGESEGNSVELTVTGEKRDLEAAIDYLQKSGYNTFGIVAASFAGGAVSLYAAEHDIKSLVLWNATIDYHSILEPELPWAKKNFGKKAMQKLERDGFIAIGSSKFKIGKPLLAEIRKLEPWKELLKLKIPILFIHGDKDSYVPYADSVKYAKMLNAKLITIKGAEHGFHDKKENTEQADKATIEYFLQNM